MSQLSPSSPPLPTVAGSFGDRPEISFPAVEPPQDLAVEVLSHGEGDRVESGDDIEVDYHGQVWGGHVIDTSYDRGSPVTFPIGVGAVIAGWDTGLVGQAVGSRVLLSIPPQLGYGSRGMPQAGIQGTDTLVFVVDIRGTHHHHHH